MYMGIKTEIPNLPEHAGSEEQRKTVNSFALLIRSLVNVFRNCLRDPLKLTSVRVR